jgi:predicted GIY-YIG superfamily endonuclease
LSHERWFFVYIRATSKHGTPYTGMTNDVMCSQMPHPRDIAKGF